MTLVNDITIQVHIPPNRCHGSLHRQTMWAIMFPSLTKTSTSVDDMPRRVNRKATHNSKIGLSDFKKRMVSWNRMDSSSLPKSRLRECFSRCTWKIAYLFDWILFTNAIMFVFNVSLWCFRAMYVGQPQKTRLSEYQQYGRMHSSCATINTPCIRVHTRPVGPDGNCSIGVKVKYPHWPEMEIAETRPSSSHSVSANTCISLKVV